MIWLFVGMIASGIGARVALLSHRGGWLLEDQARKSNGLTIFELSGTVAGIAAFVVSFLLFQWWVPLVALALGYWFVAPFVVTRTSYPFFYQTQFVTSLVALVCSCILCATYFKVF